MYDCQMSYLKVANEIYTTANVDIKTSGHAFKVAEISSSDELFKLFRGRLEGALDCNSQALTSVGGATMAGNLDPTVTNTYKLGSSTKVWDVIYGKNIVGTGFYRTPIVYNDTQLSIYAAANLLLLGLPAVPTRIQGSFCDMTSADIRMGNLPVADPHVVGQLWNNGGVLTVSAG